MGRFKYQYDTDYTDQVHSFGGGLDIQATHHINIRAIDYEHQQWLGYPASESAPQVITVGAAYAFR
jgi:hypothetical protein